MSILGPIISGASSLLGGILSSGAAKDAAEEQAELQKEFAQNAIRWKVADAKAAGVHPLYALGANTVSYSPVSVGDTSIGSALSDMGQDVGRAVEAVQSQPERDAAKKLTLLQLERAGLENEYLKTQIQGQVTSNLRNAQVPPPFPGLLAETRKGPQSTDWYKWVGLNLRHNPWFSDAETIENIHGDSELAQTLHAMGSIPADVIYNLGLQFAKGNALGDSAVGRLVRGEWR